MHVAVVLFANKLETKITHKKLTGKMMKFTKFELFLIAAAVACAFVTPAHADQAAKDGADAAQLSASVQQSSSAAR